MGEGGERRDGASFTGRGKEGKRKKNFVLSRIHENDLRVSARRKDGGRRVFYHPNIRGKLMKVIFFTMG